MDINKSDVLDALDMYVFCKDLNGDYTYVNEPFVRISGKNSREEIIGNTDHQLVWSKQADFYESCDLQVINGRPVIRQEQIQIRKFESTRVMMTKKALLSSEGTTIGIIGTFFDCKDKLILEATGSWCEERRRLYLEFVQDWLSYTEVRVCFYIIQGFSAAKIADKTDTSISTVRFHIENIKDKMQCTNKSEITEVAMRTGIAWKIMSLQHIEGSK